MKGDKQKLEKLKKALEYAKKENNELKVINIKENIKEINERIKKGR